MTIRSKSVAAAALVAAGLLSAAVRADDAVTIKNTDDVRTIHTANYDATVGSDGNLIDLQIKGKSFIYHTDGLPRGIYLYKDGVVSLTAEDKSKTEVVATGDVAKIDYTFAADKVTVKITNTGTDGITVYLGFDPEVTAVASESGDKTKMPAQMDVTNPTFFRDASKLTFAGKFNLFVWGDQNLPIGQIALASKATVELTLTPAAATDDEAKAVAEMAKR